MKTATGAKVSWVWKFGRLVGRTRILRYEAVFGKDKGHMPYRHPGVYALCYLEQLGTAQGGDGSESRWDK